MITIILVLVAWYCLLPPAYSVSASARRIEDRFTLVRYSNNTTPTPASPLSEPCPDSVTFSHISTYRNINPDDPDTVYDGILWKDLLVDGVACTESTLIETTTYFEPSPPSPAETPTDAANPWFLLGFDNSPLRCPSYNPLYPTNYFFTDDLPRFRDRLIRESLLRPDYVENPLRGDIYLFTLFISEDGNVRDPNVCVFIADSAEGPEINSAPSDEPEMEDDGPVCLSDRMALAISSDQESHSILTRPVSRISVGDELSHAYQVGLATRRDIVISFSHRDPFFLARFVAIGVRTSLNVTHALELSAGHLVYMADGSVTRAGDVCVGDFLLAIDGGDSASVSVTNISQVTRRGVYAPVTQSGRLILDGVIVSCYTDALGDVTAHALAAPVRALSRILIADWCALIDILRVTLFR